MDKKTSISTGILVLLILLTLVSLASSAYLFFSLNIWVTETREEIVKDNEYEEWNTYTSENVFATIKYPSNWILTENEPFEEDSLATEQDASKWLMVSTLPGEKGNYESYVSIHQLTKDYSAMDISDVSEYLTKISAEISEPGPYTTLAFNCDKDNIITKWEVETYKCSEEVDEIGNSEAFYFVLRNNIYSISYPTVGQTNSEIIEKILNSIVLYQY